MPDAATLNNSTATLAFTVPAGARGIVIWNQSATELRIGMGRAPTASGAQSGIPLAAGDSETRYYSHTFDRPLTQPLGVYIYQASGSGITSGVGWDMVNH
jgi:hypothetical protein